MAAADPVPRPDLWTSRDLPVLRVLVDLYDRGESEPIGLREVGDALGLTDEEVGRSYRALWGGASGTGYIEAIGDYDWPYPNEVTRVYERAYRAVGAWPTPDSLAERLEAAFKAAAAAELDPEKKSKLQAVLGAFSGIGRAVTTDVLTQVVERQMGLI